MAKVKNHPLSPAAVDTEGAGSEIPFNLVLPGQGLMATIVFQFRVLYSSYRGLDQIANE